MSDKRDQEVRITVKSRNIASNVAFFLEMNLKKSSTSIFFEYLCVGVSFLSFELYNTRTNLVKFSSINVSLLR